MKKLSILILIAVSCMGVSSCPENAPDFNWNPALWAGDARSQSITRMENGKHLVMKTSDARFDDMICTHKSEPGKATKEAIRIINQCERWKSKTAAADAETFVMEEMEPEEILEPEPYYDDLEVPSDEAPTESHYQ